MTDKERGLYRKYIILRNNGEMTDPDAEYFVLRLDKNGEDKKHIIACNIAINAYAQAIEDHLPELAKDIREKYPL